MEIANATTSHMKVNPNRNLNEAAPISPAPQRPAVPAISGEPDFQASSKLAQKLATTPTVRADKVAQAKALIADPNYPDAKTIRQVAQKLADNIQPHPTAE